LRTAWKRRKEPTAKKDEAMMGTIQGTSARADQPKKKRHAVDVVSCEVWHKDIANTYQE